MTIIPLYRYFRTDGGVTVSPIKPDGEYTQLSRLIADDGFVLTDGENFTPCVDTENIGMWSEIADVTVQLQETE